LDSRDLATASPVLAGATFQSSRSAAISVQDLDFRITAGPRDTARGARRRGRPIRANREGAASGRRSVIAGHCRALNARSIPTARGGERTAMQVVRVLDRL
jgi:hypothetical protein